MTKANTTARLQTIQMTPAELRAYVHDMIDGILCMARDCGDFDLVAKLEQLSFDCGFDAKAIAPSYAKTNHI